MEKTPIEMIKILSSEQLELAREFVDLGVKLNCKSQVRFAGAHKTWKCVMSQRKPARILYTIECAEEKWHIKACLWNINAYRNELNKCSEKIKNIIKEAYECKSCNTHCKGGAQFTFEDIQYTKCVGCCFYFAKLEKNEWKQLLCLIEKEHEATNTTNYFVSLS